MRLIKVNKRFAFNMHDPVDIRLLTRLRLDFTQLNEHEFGHNFVKN